MSAHTYFVGTPGRPIFPVSHHAEESIGPEVEGAEYDTKFPPGTSFRDTLYEQNAISSDPTALSHVVMCISGGESTVP